MIFDLFFQAKTLCPFCQEESLQDDFLCPTCRRQVPFIGGRRQLGAHDLYFPYLYHGLLRERIHDFKFYGKRFLYRSLGQLLLEGMQAQLGEDWDCFVPIPMDGYKKRHRGFAQVEELLEPALEYYKIPLVQGLRKLRRTGDQHRLGPGERKHNLKGAFGPGQEVRDKKVLLIDDVATTGATLQEAARVLQGAGAASLTFYTLSSINPEEFCQGDLTKR